MTPFDAYPWVSMALSVLVLALFGAHMVDAANARIRYHDDRSAYELLVALTMFICSIGLFVSSLGRFLVDEHHDLAVFGLSMVRGALVVTALVMLIADRRLPRVIRL
jgi:undecaprenyl pyrophosphate phosphatase UppP